MNEDDEEELEALEAAANAALAAADALVMNPSVEQEAAEMARIKQRAKEHGVNPKSHGEHGWAGSIMRKFEPFLERHGERLQYDNANGPEPEHMEEFVHYCSSGAGRVNFSAVNASFIVC